MIRNTRPEAAPLTLEAARGMALVITFEGIRLSVKTRSAAVAYVPLENGPPPLDVGALAPFGRRVEALPTVAKRRPRARLTLDRRPTRKPRPSLGHSRQRKRR